VDASELTSALVNIAVNANDANRMAAAFQYDATTSHF
jgi:hypothetical protein